MALPGSALPLFGDRVPNGDDRTAPPEESGPAAAFPSPPGWAGPLVRAAWPLLSLLGRIVAGATSADPALLQGAVAGQVRQFEQAALGAGISPREVSAARYALCSAVDEAVLLSPWGRASSWNQGTLLSRFHGETWGGEKVFAIIERVLQAPGQHGDLAELLHTILLLGFQGQFRVERDGTAKADAVRDRLARTLRGRMQPPAGGLAPLPPRRPAAPRIRSPLPIWLVALFCFVAVLCVFGALRFSLQDQAEAVAATIDGLVPALGPGAATTAAGAGR